MFKILTLFLVLFVSNCQAGDEFYDYRCICVCPSFTVIGEAETNRKIYIDVLNKENCSCENVLKSWKPNQTDMLKTKFCPRCNCNFEVRNTTTMKIVVIIIICILSLLFIYMGFLLCLDPLMNRRSARAYQEQRNEDISMTSDARTPLLQDVDQESGDDQPFANPMASRANVINRVTQEQSKWKRQVQEQRRTVYDKHTLLN